MFKMLLLFNIKIQRIENKILHTRKTILLSLFINQNVCLFTFSTFHWNPNGKAVQFDNNAASKHAWVYNSWLSIYEYKNFPAAIKVVSSLI